MLEYIPGCVNVIKRKNSSHVQVVLESIAHINMCYIHYMNVSMYMCVSHRVPIGIKSFEALMHFTETHI